MVLMMDLSRLHYLSLKQEGEFDPDRLLDGVLKKIGPSGTLLIPSFNFDLKNGQHWDLRGTLPMTGALAKRAFERGDFQRSSNPLHSFLVKGQRAEAFLAAENRTSFGLDSPFHQMYQLGAKTVSVDLPLQDSFTFIHYVERMENVKYRKKRGVHVHYRDAEGNEEWRQYEIFSKRAGWLIDMAPLEESLRGVGKSGSINGIPYTVIPCQEGYEIVKEDLKRNRRGSFARFYLKYYFRDRLKALLRKAGVFRTKMERVRDLHYD